MDGFVDVSVGLTGFDSFDLHATGVAALYLETALDQVGTEAFERFLDELDAAGGDPGRLEGETSRDIARAITHLWYLGVWPQLARSVHTALGREKANVPFTVSPEAYTEGLVWRTFHGHPAGAKAPGFGTWSDPPPGAPPVPRVTAAGRPVGKPEEDREEEFQGDIS
ncbi:hypothetical protein SMD11_6008 [Streptomyces albireticuli]|uniref:Sorbitol dehydrogenase n=1 Tax=Streptomyces albireticuli TaxID=1940 RepID=A0A1Z2LBA4_9ACTN|nr:hypothetical protein [Streptomyces albireticuli]ARZ71584.1 hypothetical protein SMD11_6008 [Streptomyces albireticuli]